MRNRRTTDGALEPAAPHRESFGRAALARPRVRNPQFRKAFTLIELVVCIAVGSIISGAAGMLLWNASAIRSDASARGEICDEGAMALEVMTRYLREITQNDNCLPADDANFCPSGDANISTANYNQINFGVYGFRNVAGSGMVEMTTDTGSTWRPLVKDVSGLTITYFDRLNASLSPLPLSAAGREDVRRVRITLSLSRGTQSVKLRTSLYLRSFMNEVTTP